MTIAEFWNIVDRVKRASGPSLEKRASVLGEELAKLAPAELVAFDQVLGQLSVRAYNWHLWAAATVIWGGFCSDDVFLGFRPWLISLGREQYESALADPDSLAEVEFGNGGEEEAFFEAFYDVVNRTYEAMTGNKMPIGNEDFPSEPTGKPWEYKELPSLCPRLWAKWGDG
ncbi:MAG: DUF4240 domain-containing protein [Phycisphaeraceae bacterium]